MGNTLKCLGFGLLLALAPDAASAQPLTLRADAWCPYNCQPDTDKPGYMVEVASKIFADAGGVNYQLMPWTRALEEAKTGRIQAVTGATRADGEGLVFGTEALGATINVIITKRGERWRYTGIDSLAGKRLAAVSDYSYGPELDEYIARHADDSSMVELAAGDDVTDQNLKKLLAGRVDVVIEDRNVAEFALVAQGMDGLVDMYPTDAGTPLFIAFSPADPAAKAKADMLDKGIRALRQSGDLSRILARYGLQDWIAAK